MNVTKKLLESPKLVQITHCGIKNVFSIKFLVLFYVHRLHIYNAAKVSLSVRRRAELKLVQYVICIFTSSFDTFGSD